MPLQIAIPDGGGEVSIVDALAEEEHQSEQIVELESENQNMSDNALALPSVAYTPAPPVAWREGDYESLFQERAIELLGLAVSMPPNFCRVSEERVENSLVQKQACQILMRVDAQNRYQIALLDLSDARAVSKYMTKVKAHQATSRVKKDENYYLFSGLFVINSDGEVPNFTLGTSDSDLSFRILQKLFTAAPRLTKLEAQYLKRLKPVFRGNFLVIESELRSQSPPPMQIARKLLKKWPHLAPFVKSCTAAIEV